MDGHFSARIIREDARELRVSLSASVLSPIWAVKLIARRLPPLRVLDMHDQPRDVPVEGLIERYPNHLRLPLWFVQPVYHMAADRALDASALADLSPVPVIRWLDARLFTMKEYRVVLRPGAGHLLASTLHFFGGAGHQSRHLDGKPSARCLLHEMMAYLIGDARQD